MSKHMNNLSKNFLINNLIRLIGLLIIIVIFLVSSIEKLVHVYRIVCSAASSRAREYVCISISAAPPKIISSDDVGLFNRSFHTSMVICIWSDKQIQTGARALVRSRTHRFIIFLFNEFTFVWILCSKFVGQTYIKD